MIKQLKKISLIALMLMVILPIKVSAFAMFDDGAITGMRDQSDDVVNNNYNPATNENSVHVIVGQVITVFLGLLATIFIILIILAGYNWMTASGRKEKVEKAQETIKVAIIGLLIILGAYIVTYFVFSGVPTGVPMK